MSTDRPIEILLVDDQRLMRDGPRTLLELHPDPRVVGEAGDGIEAEALVERLRPRVVLMDLRMPRRDGVEATRRIAARFPFIQVLVLTTFDDDDLVFRSIGAGASDYLLKDVGSDVLADAVRAAGRGESPLQPSIARKVIKRLQSDAVVPRPALKLGLAGDRHDWHSALLPSQAYKDHARVGLVVVNQHAELVKPP